MSFIMIWRRLTQPIVIALIMVLLALLFTWIDRPLALYFRSNSFFNAYWIHQITHLGLGLMYMGGFLVLFLFFKYIKPHEAYASRCLFLWLCALVPSIICLLLKVSLGRARPLLWFKDHLYGFYGLSTHPTFWSFPSGHTTTIMGVCFGLCVLFPKYWWAFLSCCLSIALSRVLLTQHFLSDVVAATYFSFVEVGVLVWVLQKKPRFMNLFSPLERLAC